MENQENKARQPEEPSVLDYLRYKLTFDKRAQALEIPAEIEVASTYPKVVTHAWPWRSLGALLFALAAQISFEPTTYRQWGIGVVLYLVSFLLIIWAYSKSEWELITPTNASIIPDTKKINLNYVIFAGLLSVFTFLTLSGNRFTPINVTLWFLSTACIIRAFWIDRNDLGGQVQKLISSLGKLDWSLRLRWDYIIFIIVIAISVYFRTYMLNATPPEMISDHAEKLLDVVDVLEGKTAIYFPRNTGREALQFYLIALTAKLFGTGISFLSMKIGTVACGLLTLPYIYLLGKEIGNRQVGLYALAFAGIAYWPNIISRIALRYTLYPFFVAPALYYLIRGLRGSNRNDFILSGIALGIGLHGYTPIRILPFVVVVAVGMYLIHPQSRGNRKLALFWLLILAVISMVIFLPLLRYALENPDIFAYRSFTRLSTVERPLPGPAWQIFLSNLWNALRMFAWDNGSIWTVSVPYRPALDFVTAALFHLGAAILFFRYILKRYWYDLFLLISIPLLMMPSILSLAFPGENPVLSRTSGALVPVFVIVGIGLESILAGIRSKINQSYARIITVAMGIVLFGLASMQNYDLVFNQYQNLYKRSSWNTHEMGKVIQSFASSVGDVDTAWVVAYPHWVDARLVGINAGYPSRDFAIFAENISVTVADPRAKIFLLKPDDTGGLSALQQVYPQGALELYDSNVENHDFYIYFVPPSS